jgi:SGNH hydrolase-like domain, acetyltransferase AlgX
MTLQSPQPIDCYRVRWAIAALIVTILPWISVILIAHEYLPGSIALTNELFGVALLATYFGCWSLAVVVSSSSSLMFFRALATTLVVVTSLLILEVPAMLKLVHWTVVMRRLSGDGQDYRTAFVPDKDLAFRRIPNLHWSGRPASDIEEAYWLPRTLATPITFTYDQWGYRNTTEMERASIVLIGDSFVEGWYVSDEQTVASRLAHRLGQYVANLGVAGYGTMQELRVLKGDALNRNPKVIAWFFFEGNDLYDDELFERFLAAPPGPEEQVPRLQGLTHGHNWRKRSFTINAFHWIRRWSHPIVPNVAPFWALLSGSSKRIYFDYREMPWTEYEESRWEKAKETFRAGIEAARGGGTDVILVYVPIKFRVYREFIEIPPDSPLRSWGVWTSLPRKFMEFCRSVSVPCVDLTDRLQQAVRKGVDVYALTDTHWSSDGHAVVAAELERVLRGLDLVLPRIGLPDAHAATLSLQHERQPRRIWRHRRLGDPKPSLGSIAS